MKFIGIWILNPLKPVAGSQWHWGLRCLASIFRIRVSFLFLVTSAFSRGDFVEMLHYGTFK